MIMCLLVLRVILALRSDLAIHKPVIVETWERAEGWSTLAIETG